MRPRESWTPILWFTAIGGIIIIALKLYFLG